MASTQQAPTQVTGLGELGKTTSTRGWLALVAILLVIVAFAFWGLFGTIPVQSTISATVTDGTTRVQIPAGVEGVVGSLTLSPGDGSELPAGTTIATVTTSSGTTVDIKTPSQMSIAFDVIDGTPVTRETIIAHGIPTAAPNSDQGSAQVYAFLGIDEVQTVQSAQSLSVTPTSPALAGTPAPIAVEFVGTVPVTERQIALLTGNALYAQQAYQAADGAPYTVVFKYLNAADADKVTGTAAAEITVTKSTPHPLALLFGS